MVVTSSSIAWPKQASQPMMVQLKRTLTMKNGQLNLRVL